MGYAPPLTYRRFGRSQWRRVRCAATEKRRSRSRTRTRRKAPKRPHRLPACTARPNWYLVREPIRQEALAGDRRARPQRAPYRFGDDRANIRGRQPHDRAAYPYHSTRALTVVRTSFGSRRIPYTCTAPEPVLELPRRDLARRTFGICCLYESCPA